MLKKIFIITSLTLITSHAYALCCGLSAKYLAIKNISPYIGFTGGYNKAPWKVKNAERTSSFNFTTEGKRGGVFAGVSGRICPGLYLATEVFANKDSAASAYKIFDSTGRQGKTKLTSDYGLSFIQGYMFTPYSILYSRLGLIVANIQWLQIPGPTQPGGVTSHQTVLGGQVGLGFQQALTPRIFVRLEWDYSDYQSRMVFGNRIFPQNNQFDLGLLYKFIE